MKYSSLGKTMNRRITSKLALFSLVMIFILLASSQSFAQDTFTVSEVVYSFEAERLQVTHPAGLAYVPEGDAFVVLSAEPVGQAYVYIADSGSVPAVPANPDPSAFPRRLYLPQVSPGTNTAAASADASGANTGRAGQVVEIALDQPAEQFHAPATTTTLNLVRTTQTYKWSPSSPDPDGGASTAWVESGLNYNNAPPISGSPLSSLGSVATGTLVEFDVTTAVTGNGTYSFAIKSSSTNSVYYNSNDAGSHTPVLVISQ